MEKIHIVYGTDNNYIFPTFVSAASAVWFSRIKTQLVIHLFDAGVTEDNYRKFEEGLMRLGAEVTIMRHRLSSEMFNGFGEWKGSVVTYSRMFMAELLPDVDWAIYFDGDTLWLGDPAELWKLRDDKFLVQASVDPPRPLGDVNPEFKWYADRGLEIDSSNYLCMGLMLANLGRMRKEGIPGKCRAFMREYPNPRIVDQTVLNYVCRGRSKALPKQWGVFSAWHRDVDLSMPSSVHYVSDVPWVRTKANKLFSDVVLLWFEFCDKVLGLHEIGRFSLFSRLWRRIAFIICKQIQPLIKLNRYVHSRLRNTHGIPKEQYAKIINSFSVH